MASILIHAADKAEPFEKKITSAATLVPVYVSDGPRDQPEKLCDIGICNYHTSAVTITVEIYRIATTTSFKRFSAYSLPANSTLETDWVAMLYGGDELRVSASVANVVDVTGLVLQVF